MASRKEQKEQLRKARLEREQKAAAVAAARRRRTGIVLGTLLGAGLIIAVVGILSTAGSDDSTASKARASSWPDGNIPARKAEDLDAAVKASGCVMRSPRSEGAGHTEQAVTYKTQPPTSGPHFPTPAHDAATLAAPKPYESLVHALEHGRVILWFKPSAAPATRGALKKIYDEDKALTVLTPNSRSMPYEVAATAWTKLLGCPTYNDRVADAMRAFRDTYRLKGPEYFPNPE